MSGDSRLLFHTPSRTSPCAASRAAAALLRIFAVGAVIWMLMAVMRLDLRLVGSGTPARCGMLVFVLLASRLARDGGDDPAATVRFLSEAILALSFVLVIVDVVVVLDVLSNNFAVENTISE